MRGAVGSRSTGAPTCTTDFLCCYDRESIAGLGTKPEVKEEEMDIMSHNPLLDLLTLQERMNKLF